MSLTIRNTLQEDLAGIMAIQQHCYSDLTEPDDILLKRWQTHAETNWLALSSGKPLGYLIAYPSLYGNVTRLGAEFESYADADVLYLHDMAVSPQARGLGIAAELLQYAQQYATDSGLSTLALVAVQGSVPYWSRYGFSVVTAVDTQMQQALDSYIGQQAVYMVKSLQDLTQD